MHSEPQALPTQSGEIREDEDQAASDPRLASMKHPRREQEAGEGLADLEDRAGQVQEAAIASLRLVLAKAGESEAEAKSRAESLAGQLRTAETETGLLKASADALRDSKPILPGLAQLQARHAMLLDEKNNEIIKTRGIFL